MGSQRRRQGKHCMDSALLPDSMNRSIENAVPSFRIPPSGARDTPSVLSTVGRLSFKMVSSKWWLGRDSIIFKGNMKSCRPMASKAAFNVPSVTSDIGGTSPRSVMNRQSSLIRLSSNLTTCFDEILQRPSDKPRNLE